MPDLPANKESVKPSRRRLERPQPTATIGVEFLTRFETRARSEPAPSRSGGRGAKALIRHPI
jgi:hypothetical protein